MKETENQKSPGSDPKPSDASKEDDAKNSGSAAAAKESEKKSSEQSPGSKVGTSDAASAATVSGGAAASGAGKGVVPPASKPAVLLKPSIVLPGHLSLTVAQSKMAALGKFSKPTAVPLKIFTGPLSARDRLWFWQDEPSDSKEQKIGAF